MSSSAARELEWDSAFFETRIAKLDASRVDDEGFEAALGWCRERGIECLYLYCDAADLVAVRRAERAGARFVDVRLELTARARAAGAREPHPGVRPARPGDVPALRAIAAASHHASRFYADGRLDRERCDELYATWIQRSCSGWAQAVFCAVRAGAPAGYLTCHLRGERRGDIGLVAVAAEARGQGLGRALLDRALAWFAEQDVDEVTVATQARSVDAQRLYQSAGFRVSKAGIWHHLWFCGTRPR